MSSIPIIDSDLEFLMAELEKRPSKPPRERVSAYAEEKRILPPDTPFPGRWSNSRTPYAIEIMDNMSPHSPVIQQAIMKGAQLGLTAAAENVLGYWMDETPAPLMLISATDDLLEEWANKRLEPLIDSCGFREKIRSQIENRKSRRSGDRAMSKEFAGGFLLLGSAQSPAKLRSNSIRVLIRDEIDGAPRELRTGEGNWLDVSFARTNGWGARKKIMDFSTPTLYDTSAIYPAWDDGDKREYHVPCPFCGAEQKLEFSGLVPEISAGHLVNCKYRCKHCDEMISNHHKTAMLAGGRWVPTATAKEPNYRSYHISSLYSPVGMLSWRELYQRFLKAEDDPEAMRSFTNLYLGEPYRETGARPKIEKVIEHRGEYRAGEVVNDVLWITAGADVQRGKDMYAGFSDADIDREIERMRESGKEPWISGVPRIELELIGHGHGYRTYSIEYKIFYGHTHDPYGGAWEKLREWIVETGLVFQRLDGSKVGCASVLIDSGDGERMNTVYAFCEEFPGVLPCKGDQVLKKKLHEKGDEVTGQTFKRYAVTNIGQTQRLVTVSTNYYKSLVYKSLELHRVEGPEQRPRFADFPRNYPDYYFKMLTAEEKHNDGSFHAGGRRNEALDARVYGLAASDFWIDMMVYQRREALRKRGASQKQAEQIITTRSIVERMRNQRIKESAKLS